jgi:CRISPR-associated endonuclease Cas2
MTYVVAYDIVDNRIRARLARYLEKCGVRVQKSVFVVKVERYRFKAFTRTLRQIAGPNGDIVIFRQCSGCRDRAMQLSEFEPQYWIY